MDRNGEMIQLLEWGDIDRARWDRCVDSDPRSLVYGRSFYLEMLGGKLMGMVEGDYRSVMPIFVNRKFGLTYVYRPFGAQQLGVFSDEPKPETAITFLSAIPLQWRWVDLYLNEGDLSSGTRPPSWRVEVQPNYLLRLDRSYQRIYEGYNQRTLRNLKKSKTSGIEIFEHGSPEELIRLFRENRGQSLPSLTDSHYETHIRIQHRMLHRGEGLIWMAQDERNTPIAGFFATVYGNRITLLFTGQDAEGREKHAMTALLNELILTYCEKAVYLDFEGSKDPGLSAYIKGFGAELAEYPRLVRNRLPFPLNRWFDRRS